MKVKAFVILICLSFGHQLASSQAYYRLTYRLLQNNDSSLVNALLIIYENGSGLARINPADTAVFEMTVSEQYLIRSDGSVDTTLVIYEGSDPVLKRGRFSGQLKPVSFWFRSNPVNYMIEPWLVSLSSKDTSSGNNFQSIELLDNRQLSDPAFVLKYFSKNEPFYQNRFGPKPRGFLEGDNKKIRLFLLVVAQTFDKTIGPATLHDARHVVEMFSNVAAFLGVKPVFDSVYGDRYGRASVKKAIDKLKPAPRDIVVFWYSGHGFSDVNNRDPRRRNMKYSNLDLLDPRQRPRPDPRDSAMNIETIYNLIKSKGGRLNMVVSDCCNDEMVPKKEDKAPPTPKPRGPVPKWNWNNVYSLFIKTKSSMLIAAATQGEQAFGDNVRGSVFTNNFIASLTANLLPDASGPEWMKIWKAAQQQTITRINNAKIECPLPFQPKNVCKQTPPLPKFN